ncbi:MAG TPA: ABC transporter ATP-binding protein, partial [Lachnospiraceae bacterium]|nr:ABC transporter ATP-binding protein [Lachnospiraceae bacterium]
MAQIRVTDLTFAYENSADEVFENASFQVDTDWKLGLIGRNGKGKTTLLRLLMGEFEYRGSITGSTRFDYFPYSVSDSDLSKTSEELIEKWKPEAELWEVLFQMNQIG